MYLDEIAYFRSPFLFLRIAKQGILSILCSHSLAVWIRQFGNFRDRYLLVCYLISRLRLPLIHFGFFFLVLLILFLQLCWAWTEVNRVPTFTCYHLSATFLVILYRRLNELSILHLFALNVRFNLWLTCSRLGDICWDLLGFRGHRGCGIKQVLLHYRLGRM
jgi:hypothetical protein